LRALSGIRARPQQGPNCVGAVRQHLEREQPWVYLFATCRDPRGYQMTALARSAPGFPLKRAILAVLAALSLASCGINSVPTADEQVKAAWGNLQADYQRRADLIPNLV